MMGAIATWGDSYIRQSRKRGKFSPSTARHVSYTIRSLDKSFGTRPIETFGARAIERTIGPVMAYPHA